MKNKKSVLVFFNNKFRALFLLFAITFFSISFSVHATHIVGGELSYKCLGGNQYEIRLRVYRDCYNGVPPFDNPAAVGIFDVNNVLVTTVYLNFPGSTVLPPTVAQADACVQGIGNVCIEVAEYIGTVVLPPRPGGYQLAYQRCCRNSTISNIVNPGNEGATYYARIPDPSVATCNSSPLFTNFPSIFVCVNNPIIFDNSATDADGDSIAYSLCAPYTGATSGNSEPQPPNPPPYTSVTWQAPYSASNLLGGVPLAIDPKTGLMTGTPNTLGQFVIGVCADEYRNGVLINTTKRDFQFNIINCKPDVVAAAASYVSNCNDHTVTFVNNSVGSTSYHWNFGDPTVTTDTSGLKNPTYTYPSLGTYTVSLIAFSPHGPKCNDTLKTLVVTVDTCKACAMNLGITKVDATCSGSGGGCTSTPNTLAEWNSNTRPSPDPCPGTGINIWYDGVPDPIGTSPSNTYYLCGATYYSITGTQWSLHSEPPGNACPGKGSFVLTRDPGQQYYYVCPCSGGGTGTPGSATVTSSGGTGPYVYSWSPNGGSTATINNLTAGTYSVTVTDANGCVKTASVIIDANSTIVLTPSQTAPSSCVASDGTATVSVSGGTAPYTYLWNNGKTTSTITGLSPGLYTAIITDANGCNRSVTISIAQPVTINVGTSQKNAKCKNNNGTGTAIPSGGSGPYAYLWSTSPSQTTVTANNLKAGYYVVTVTDAGGCSNTAAVTIVDSSLTLTSSSTNVSCNGNSNGTATLSATNGTPGYTYSWNTSPVQTTVTATGLSAGTYIGKVTDAAGCIDSVAITITQPSPLLAEPKNTSTISCAGVSSGSAHVDVSGGTPGFTYLWNNNQTTQNISNLSAGTYTVTVTDSKGCTASNTVVITAPPLLSATTITSDATCNGTNSGAATVSPLGGSPNYTYLWSTSPVQTNQTATNLSAGTYTVTVTDSKGCTVSASITINQPSAIILSTGTVPVTCSATSGSVSVTGSGGTGSITYLWSPTGKTTATVTGLSAGTYTVTATDGSGCTVSSAVTVTGTITAGISGTTTICPGGSTVLTATGGGTYVWSANAGSATTASVTVSPSSTDTYTVTITAGTCTTSATQTVTVSGAISASISGNTTICAGSSTTLTANGGGTYSWDNGATTTSITVSPVSNTTYTVTVTVGSCTTTATQIVVVNSLPTAAISGTSLICTGSSTTLTASGGGTYSWNNGATTTSITVSPVSTTTYTVTVSAGGCTANATQTVTVSTPVATISGPTTVCLGNSITLTAGGGGTYSWDNGATTTSITVSPAVNTTYTVTATIGTCTATATQAVTVGAAIVPGISGTSTICSGNSTTLTASGGGTYSWDNGATTTSITVSPVSLTTYTVTVSNGSCSATATISVAVNPTPVATISGSATVCKGASTVLTAGGGGTYLWSANAGGSTTATVTVSPGASSTYTVTVTSGGCSATKAFTVTETNIVLATSKTDVSCNGTNNGTASVTASGGTLLYTYSWNTNPIQPDSMATGLSAGTYTVTVTDANGCTNTAKVTINGQINNVVAGFSVKYKVTCDAGVTTIFADSSSGATSWLWNFGDGTTSQLQNPTHTFSYGTTATVTLVAMDGGCSDTMTLVITTKALNDYIKLSVPNVFTPNDDGTNDCFQIAVGNDLEKCVQLKIFDRWGLTIFETTKGVCWDGRTTAGLPATQGTYFYLIKINDTEVHGSLSLFR